jgi:hypothetical protein
VIERTDEDDGRLQVFREIDVERDFRPLHRAMRAERIRGWRVERGLRPLVMRHRARIEHRAELDPARDRRFDLGDDGEPLALRQSDGRQRPIEVRIGPDDRAREVDRRAAQRQPVGVAEEIERLAIGVQIVNREPDIARRGRRLLASKAADARHMAIGRRDVGTSARPNWLSNDVATT